MKLQRKEEKRRTLGMSRRAYATKRGVSDTTVRRYLGSGLLAPALLDDGTIDHEVADAILARSLTRGSGAIPGIEAARKRKLCAEIALLQDELATLRNDRVTPQIRLDFIRALLKICARHTTRVPIAGARLAGAPPIDAFTAMTETVFETLNAISTTPIHDRAADDADPEEAAGGARLDGLDLTDLTALKADLQAQRLELTRSTTRGELVLIAAIEEDIVDRVSNFRTRLLALPSRAAPLFQSIATADEAGVIAFDLAVEALAQLVGDEMNAAEMKQEMRDALE